MGNRFSLKKKKDQSVHLGEINLSSFIEFFIRVDAKELGGSEGLGVQIHCHVFLARKNCAHTKSQVEKWGFVCQLWDYDMPCGKAIL